MLSQITINQHPGKVIVLGLPRYHKEAAKA
jgi:hypothetical protein